MAERVRTSAATLVSSQHGVATVALAGYVSFDALARALALFDAALERDATVRGVVLDLLGIDGFEPGIPARAIQWVAANRVRLRTALVVTMSPVLIGTARAASLMVRDVAIYAAATRAEAIAAAERDAAPRRRHASGIRRHDASALEATQQPPALGAVARAPLHEPPGATVHPLSRRRAG